MLSLLISLISDNLRLAAILSKACSLYSNKDRRIEDMDYEDNSDEDLDCDDSGDDFDAEEEVQEDHQLDDLLEQDLNWELEIARRKKRWKAKEEELRERAAKEKDSTLHPETNLKSSQPKQIFTKAGASGILINDLVSIMESSKVRIKKRGFCLILYPRKPKLRWTPSMTTSTFGMLRCPTSGMSLFPWNRSVPS